MVTAAPRAPERAPRRARYLIPRATPRRAEIIATLALLAAVGSLLLAPAVGVLAVLFRVISKISRWRPSWLAAPAGCGLVWMLAAGPGEALAGFVALPRAEAAAGGAAIAHPAALAAGLVGEVWRRDAPAQIPLALMAAAATAAAWWGMDWLHTDEWRLPATRPGLVAWARRLVRTAVVASGGVVTRGGVCLGVDDRTGGLVEVSWREAGRGVLIAGASWPEAAESGFQMLHAAIRRRKPVIAVDLSGDARLAVGVAAVCAAAGAPLRVFEAGGSCGYEPWRGGAPDGRAAALLAAVLDWGQAPDPARSSCQAWLGDLLAVAAAAPGDPAEAMIDDMARLLAPGALLARMDLVPCHHPRRDALAGRARRAARRLETEQEAAAFVAGQLAALRGSALGRLLGPGPPGGGSPVGGPIRLADVLRRRGVALFSMDRDAHGRSAERIADVVAADAAATCARLGGNTIVDDALAWFGRCETVDPGALAALGDTGMAVVMTTSSARAAASLAERSGVLVLRALDDPGLADRLAPLTGRRPRAAAGADRAASAIGPRRGPVTRDLGPDPVWEPAVPARSLCARAEGGFTLVVRDPAGRVVPAGRFVRGRVPGPPRAVAAGRAPAGWRG